jgi:FG-GAP-like repeat
MPTLEKRRWRRIHRAADFPNSVPTSSRPKRRTWVLLALVAILALAQGCGVSALDENPACPVMACPIGPTIANVRNNGVLHSGFLIGTGGDPAPTSVLISLDGAAPVTATGTANWSYMLPLPPSTSWKNGSQHTITVSALGSGNYPSTTITMRKGVNWDINGDGYPDVAVGTSQITGASAYIFLGGSGGIPGADLSANPAAPSATLTASGDLDFGYAVALGDFNGDGYADLVVGAYQSSLVAEYLSTGTGGIVTSNGGQTAIVNSPIGSDNFGCSVAVGDVNGDGYDDVAVGANITGIAYVYQSGGSSGIVNGGSPTSTIQGPTAANTSFGLPVVLADQDGDGFADLIAGGRGLASVYIFRSTGGSGVSSVTCSVSSCPQSTAALVGPASSSMGVFVAAGDVNGDGIADVLAGANAGEAAYLFQSPGSAGLPFTTCSTASCPEASAAFTSTLPGFGGGVDIGDVNGDGYGDAVIGAPNGPSAAYVFLSTGSGGIPGVDLTANPNGAATTITTGSTSDGFASPAFMGDVNGDGYADLLLGAATYNGSSIGQGATYLFLSAGTSGIASADLSANPNAATDLLGPASGSFGFSLAP